MTRKIAIVTGAGSGIGRSSARLLLEHGYGVVLVGRREAALQETADGSAHPDQALVAPANVSDPAAVAGVFRRTTERFGRVDVVFNNAGTNAPGVSIEDLTFEQWNTVLAANLTGVFLCTQAAFRVMKAQDPRGGRIINNGSISAYAPRPDSAVYTATKHAVRGLTKSTSLDGRKYDIACSQIDIGNAATEMAARFAKGVVQANGQVAVEPLLDIDHVARAVLFMADMPIDANVQFITVMPSKMPFVGRG